MRKQNCSRKCVNILMSCVVDFLFGHKGHDEPQRTQRISSSSPFDDSSVQTDRKSMQEVKNPPC
jgi:hypothetical protein